jgi:uncharacterized protein (TIGR03435 family)
MMLRNLGLLAFAATLAHAAEPPRFDVASVKRIALEYPRRGGLKREITPTSVSFHTATLGNLFEWAYGMTIYQVIGPNWLNWPTDAAYDIDAKTGSPVSEDQLKLMMQSLMVERFQLKFHRETRDTVIYALVVAKGGPKLHRSESTGEPAMHPGGVLGTQYERVSMAQFAFSLERPFQPKHVADETGLAGVFDFTLELEPYIVAADTDAVGRLDEAGALIRALPQELGLAMQRKTVPMEVLVVDHLEKNPTAN